MIDARKHFPRLVMTMSAVAVWLAGCGSGAGMQTFVLDGSVPPAVGTSSEAGLPVIELMPVSVPDYLDTTDMMRRAGINEVAASKTGRWGERLSVGVTRALAADLTRQLPTTMIATTEGPVPVRRLSVAIDSFDAGKDGDCLLAAHWTLTTADGSTSVAEDHATFTLPAGSTDDAELAATMSRLIGTLADHVASTISTR
jgi:uncharacterized lipoprotein YmbA